MVVRQINFKDGPKFMTKQSWLLTADFKRLGDLAAGTIVVYRERKTVVRKLPDAAPVARIVHKAADDRYARRMCDPVKSGAPLADGIAGPFGRDGQDELVALCKFGDHLCDHVARRRAGGQGGGIVCPLAVANQMQLLRSRIKRLHIMTLNVNLQQLNVDIGAFWRGAFCFFENLFSLHISVVSKVNVSFGNGVNIARTRSKLTGRVHHGAAQRLLRIHLIGAYRTKNCVSSMLL